MSTRAQLGFCGLVLVLISGQAMACAQPQPTQIRVNPSTNDVTYDFSQTLAQIQNIPVDTVNPYGLHTATMTQGFMKGAIKLEPEVKLGYENNTRTGKTCLWYDQITITIHIEPTIVIAREIAADRCMKQAVLEHEQKHVKADRALVNKYAQIMGNRVQTELNKRGFLIGPVAAGQAQMTAERMQQLVFQVLEHEYKKMDLERTEMQGEIDSLEEYERVSALCPDYKRPNLKMVNHEH